MERIEVLYNNAKTQAILLSNVHNIFYYTGYYNSDCKIVVANNNYFYITDSRYSEEASLTIPSIFKVVETGNTQLFPTIQHLLSGITEVGYDQNGLLYSDYLTYQQLLSDKTFATIDGAIKTQREIKSLEEIELMKKANQIADKAYAKILLDLKEGISEQQIRNNLEYYMLCLGASGVAFETIVAFGKNSSKPHAHPGSKKLKIGDVVLMDFGAKYKGYCCDMTRCVVFGKADEQIKTAYARVLAANKAAEEALEIGQPAALAHDVAVKYFASLKQDKFFIHSVGHGVGVEIHEAPTLSSRSFEFLQENNVVTIEPGLYYPDKFGIRIEDMLVVTKDGAKALNNTDKNLIII